MRFRRKRDGAVGAALICRGCGRTARADRLSAAVLADLLSWERTDEGDLCFDCQWRRGRTPGVARRVASRAS